MAPSPPAAAAPPVSPPPSRLASPALPVPPPAHPRRTGPRVCRIEVSSPTVQKGGHFAPAQDAPGHLLTRVQISGLRASHPAAGRPAPRHYASLPQSAQRDRGIERIIDNPRRVRVIPVIVVWTSFWH